MFGPIHVYLFRDPHFAPDGDTLVCIAERARMTRYISETEVARAFSGHAVYRRWLWKTYIGVWGRKNTSRLRRFLRERGAEVIIHREAPPGLRLTYWTTADERRRIRSLPPRQA